MKQGTWGGGQSAGVRSLSEVAAVLFSRVSEREIREFYLTPVAPECGAYVG